MNNVLEDIQEFDSSYDPLSVALKKSGVSKELWNAATDRVYMDGFYGPLNPYDWKEQDGRKPYFVSEALEIIVKVLDEVEDYGDFWDERIDSNRIKPALIPWYRAIYGQGFPT